MSVIRLGAFERGYSIRPFLLVKWRYLFTTCKTCEPTQLMGDTTSNPEGRVWDFHFSVKVALPRGTHPGTNILSVTDADAGLIYRNFVLV